MLVDGKRNRHFLGFLSQVCGWIYTTSWSVSFYPQPITNWRRQSTAGTSIDFPFLNLIGFSCYTIVTSCFLFSHTVRSQYAIRHPISPEPTVDFNDFVFAVHAMFWVFLVYSQYHPQIWGLRIPNDQHVSRSIAAIAVGCAIVVVAVIAIVLACNGVWHQDATKWSWIDVVYTLGNVKLVATFFKYLPQAIMNYRRQSTSGWAIWTILFDFIGGILSLAQLIIDASLQNDWSGIAGNPAKLGLSIIGLCFDLIFMVQHYILYRHASPTDSSDQENKSDEYSPLLSASQLATTASNGGEDALT